MPNNYSFSVSEYSNFHLFYNNTKIFDWYNTNGIKWTGRVYNDIIPEGNNKSIGSSSYQWKDLYLSRNLSDGSKSVTVAQLDQNILYKHTIITDSLTIEIITNVNTPLSSINDIENLFDNSIRASYITGGRKFRIETILSGYIYYVDGTSITDDSMGNLVSDTVTQY